jgi:hypothetical protein
MTIADNAYQCVPDGPGKRHEVTDCPYVTLVERD